MKSLFLLIDEPEAHLHPQWIVEFARLLVLLHKQVGLKIIVASHNPDMVSAIQSIARKEGVLQNTCFYQAERASEDSMQYVYKNLGSDISEIFKFIQYCYFTYTGLWFNWSVRMIL